MKGFARAKFFKWIIGLLSFEIIIVVLIASVLVSIVGAIAADSENVGDDDYLSALKVRQSQIYQHTEVNVDLSIHYGIDQINREETFEKDPYVHIGEDDVACFIDGSKQIEEDKFDTAYSCLNYTSKQQKEFKYYYDMYNSNITDTVKSSLGFSYPIKDPYVVTAGFKDSNYVEGSTHYGVDFVPLSDISILSSSEGIVTEAYNDCPQQGYLGNSCGGYFGNHVYVETTVEDVNYRLIYGHMSEVNVNVGDTVTNGQKIGVMGSSGNVTGAHLHFEVQIESAQGVYTSIDPMPLLEASVIDTDKTVLMEKAGIDESDYEYVDYIISHESSWNYQAENSSSGAYGLCQALPGEKMASSGSDWKTNPNTQMDWCNKYAIDRYGSWKSAYDFWTANQWW